MRLNEVLLHAPTVGIQEPEVELRGRMALAGGHEIPLSRFSKILWGSDAYIVGEPDPVLSVWIALVGERTPEPHRRRIISTLSRFSPIL